MFSSGSGLQLHDHRRLLPLPLSQSMEFRDIIFGGGGVAPSEPEDVEEETWILFIRSTADVV